MKVRGILIIDDEAYVAKLMQKDIEDNGYTLETASDGENGIRQAIANPPRLILLDILMPALDGYQVLSRLRKEPGLLRYLPIVIMTSQSDSRAIRKAMALGATDYLIKPCTPKDLLDILRRYLL